VGALGGKPPRATRSDAGNDGTFWGGSDVDSHLYKNLLRARVFGDLNSETSSSEYEDQENLVGSIFRQGSPKYQGFVKRLAKGRRPFTDNMIPLLVSDLLGSYTDCSKATKRGVRPIGGHDASEESDERRTRNVALTAISVGRATVQLNRITTLA
jgi:hypothetical protein